MNTYWILFYIAVGVMLIVGTVYYMNNQKQMSIEGFSISNKDYKAIANNPAIDKFDTVRICNMDDKSCVTLGRIK